MRTLSKILILFTLILPLAADGQEVTPDITKTYKAQVVKIVSEDILDIPGTAVNTVVQNLEVEIISKERRGEIVTFKNDYITLEEGEKFYLNHTVHSDGYEAYVVADPYRLPQLFIFAFIFIAVTVLFGGKQGVRGLVSLFGSLLLIFFVLLPGLLKGINPVLLSIGVAALIIVVGSYITHGFNRTTTTAVIGMITTIIITGIMAFLAVNKSRLTGFADDDSVYLNLNTSGTLDFAGLLLGAILIGLLGTLYDAAISQAIAVEELALANPSLTKKQVYKRALRIGREHIGALVDTLAIAYVGASLPLLLLLLSSTSAPLTTIINKEIFATEIIRIVIGSIGVILAVPITTYISARMIVGRITKPSGGGHSHAHHHHS